MSEEHNTEQQIFEAAKKVFIRKGFDAARMQDIADEAGINKALLHYYFRSKEKLFDSIFQSILKKLVPNLEKITQDNVPFNEVINRFVRTYYGFVKENPFLPLFVINEINRNPEKIVQSFLSERLPLKAFFDRVHQAIETGEIRPIDPREIILNILSLILFPIAARATMAGIIFQGIEDDYNQFLDHRIENIVKMINENLKTQ